MVKRAKEAPSPASVRANDLRHITNMQAQLVDRLVHAEERSSGRGRESENAGRRSVGAALVAILKFVQEICPAVVERQLDQRLVRLVESLGELEKGIIAPMLTARRKSGGIPASFGYNLIKAAAVFTIHRLAATGLDRRTARGAVAELLASKGIVPARKGADSKPSMTVRTIRKWEYDIGLEVEATRIFRQLERDYVLENEYVAASAGSGGEANGSRAMFADQLGLAVLQDEGEGWLPPVSESEAKKIIRRRHLKWLEDMVAHADHATKPPKVTS